MTRGFYLLIAAAVLTLAGCHRKTAADANPTPRFDTGGAPGSAADVMSHTAARFGVPVYPNAVADTSHFSMADNVAQTNPRAYLMYMTPDSVDQVVDFYKTRLNMEATDFQGTKQLKGNTSAGAQVTINVGRDIAGNQTRFVVMAFLPQTGSAGSMSTVSTTTPPPMTSPTPVRQSAATQSYTPDQPSDPNAWTFSTNNSQDEENSGGGAIPQPQDNPPGDTGSGNDESGPNDPNNAPTTPPPDDSGNGGDSGPPGGSN